MEYDAYTTAVLQNNFQRWNMFAAQTRIDGCLRPKPIKVSRIIFLIVFKMTLIALAKQIAEKKMTRRGGMSMYGAW